MSMMNREVAWRVFAQEYNQATFKIEGTEERAPSYVVTPLGAKINRAYVVGVLTETENIGSPEEPMWRARVNDPTGTFFVSAGQYQPSVSTALANMEPPAFVAVVGKSNTYSPDEDTTLVNLRGELIKEVDREQRDYWILEAARELRNRIEAVSEASKMEEISPEELVELGYDSNLADGIKRAIDFYGEPSLDNYWRTLEDSLRYVLPEYEEEKTETEEEDDEELEDEILDVIEEMEDPSNPDKGVDYEKVREEVIKDSDVSRDKFEEAVNSLRSKGKVYEPALGNLRRIY